MPLKHQPVFIIGAPRTGSTILYQILTHTLDVLYIDNLIACFYRNLFLGFWVRYKILGNRRHSSFKSIHGVTKEWTAPSECGEFWYRWFPQDRHFLDYYDVDQKSLEQIREIVSALINYFDKPLVFKNMNAGLRLRILKQIFPDAKFIYLNRDPYFTVQSLIQVREKVYGDASKWWSLKPASYEEIRRLEFPMDVIRQVYDIQQQIEEDKQLFLAEKFYKVDLYSSPLLSSLNKLKEFVGADTVGEFPQLELENRNSVPSELEQKIKDGIAQVISR